MANLRCIDNQFKMLDDNYVRQMFVCVCPPISTTINIKLEFMYICFRGPYDFTIKYISCSMGVIYLNIRFIKQIGDVSRLTIYLYSLFNIQLHRVLKFLMLVYFFFIILQSFVLEIMTLPLCLQF